MNRVKILPVFLFAAFFGNLKAQTYFTNGTARSTGGECYQLTAASNNQNGSVWYADQLDLDKDFDLEFLLNFGSKDGSGADGIVFVMQTVGTKALGQSGGGIGFDGFKPSLGVEFDDWQNGEFGDIGADHIGILKDGSVNHKLSSSLAGPVSANADSKNIEDGKPHPVRIKWNASTKTIAVYFDCSLRLSLRYDLKKDVFEGKSLVYWGFTSATGGANNVQVACLSDDIIVSDRIRLCSGNSAKLNARKSSDNTYTWSPSTFLSSSTIRNPVCTPTKDIIYTVTFKDVCGNDIVDTVTVLVDQPFEIDLGADSLLCDGNSLTVRLNGGLSGIKWNDGSSLRQRVLKNEGAYWVKAWSGSCSDTDSISIKTLRKPVISISGEETFCTGTSVLLTANVTPLNQEYIWHDGLGGSERLVAKAGRYTIEAENACGKDFAEKTVRELGIDGFSLGNDTSLCFGDTILRQVVLNGPYEYLWSTGNTSLSQTITEAGTYWFKASRDQCSKVDSLIVHAQYPPEILLPNELLLCHGQKMEIDPKVSNAQVIWQGSTISPTFSLFEFEGDLEVHAENACGEDAATVHVELIECFCDMYFPNAVTPNQDNLNEYFRPVVYCQKLAYYELSIYNRWGELLFRTEDITDVWDLSFAGDPVVPGVYFWMVRYQGNVHGTETKKRDAGTLTVLR